MDVLKYPLHCLHHHTHYHLPHLDYLDHLPLRIHLHRHILRNFHHHPHLIVYFQTSCLEIIPSLHLVHHFNQLLELKFTFTKNCLIDLHLNAFLNVQL